MRTLIAILAILCLLLPLCGTSAAAEKKNTLVLENADSLKVRRSDGGEVWYGFGNVRFRIDSTHVAADSAIWDREQDIIRFYGQVEAYDTIRHIWAQRVSYYHRDSLLIAEQDVVMIHYADSIRTESQTARFDQKREILYLEREPCLYLNYPDFENLVTVTANLLTYYSVEKRGEAEGEVVIEYKDTRATCQCAQFDLKKKVLTLTEEPYALRGLSTIRGQEMEIFFAGGEINRIEVYDDAEALFVEEGDTVTGDFSGESYLSARQIRFFFRDEEVRKIAAVGAARSKYFPAPDDTTGAGKNFVSGDSIFIFVKNRKTSKVEIKGGAEGVYITEKEGTDTLKADSLSSSVAADKDTTTVIDSVTIESSDRGISDSVIVSDSTTTEMASLEDSIHYNGDFLEFFVDNRLIRITGNSVVRQEDVVLNAGQMDYDIDKRVVLARAAVDTLEDTTVIKPLSLRDAREEIFGSRLVFNVDTKRGLIEDATTEFERSHYFGYDLYKEEEQVFYVLDGKLTPCDLEDANIHFRSKRMKLIHNDRVIARPVTMYIETLPVMVFPYYVFPLKRGRHSGILPIKLGNFERGNRFIGNLGYYWEASEYWDLQGALDFYENIGFTINSLFRYNRRYAFSGQVRGSFSRERQEYAFGESKSRRWTLSGSHTQTLPHDIRFQASGTFVSDKNYYTDYSTDPDERRNRSITSKANFNKRFGRASLSLSFNHTNNLDTDSRRSQVPSGSFTMPSFHPFGSGREADGKTIKRWYNYLYLGYRNSFAVNTFSSRETDGSKTRKEYAYIDHSISLSASQKVFKYINVSPGLSSQETWYYVMPTDQAEEAGIIAGRPYRRGAVSVGLSSNTNLYGTFPINLFSLIALRQVITPGVGFRWAPAVTKNDPVKNYIQKGGGGYKQKTMSFSLTQLFQAKVRQGEIEKKYDLLRVSSSVSHNFEATGRKYSDLSTTISSSLINNVNLSGSLVHDLYDDKDRLNWKSPRLKSFSIAITFQARGSVSDNYVRQGLGSDLPEDTTGLSASGLDYNIAAPPESSEASWNLRMSHRYSETGLLTSYKNRSHWIQFTFNMNLTDNWKIKYHQNYDIINHQTTEKVIDLYRKLPCWEGHFYWIPEGSRKGYYFKINVTAIPDIKFEKSESGLRGALLGR